MLTRTHHPLCGRSLGSYGIEKIKKSSVEKYSVEDFYSLTKFLSSAPGTYLCQNAKKSIFELANQFYFY